MMSYFSFAGAVTLMPFLDELLRRKGVSDWPSALALGAVAGLIAFGWMRARRRYALTIT